MVHTNIMYKKVFHYFVGNSLQICHVMVIGQYSDDRCYDYKAKAHKIQAFKNVNFVISLCC